MLGWLYRRLRRRGPEGRPLILELGDLEGLARSGLCGCLLAQEKARLDYLAAHEAYRRESSEERLRELTERLAHLQSVNAVVSSLINEHALEKLIADSREEAEPPARKSR
ncbi:MAG TPA: hypothetical protein VFA26_02745 [Gemmataceae bacterium]|nr:hypothetical protein [Gemmataceae bacterium]